RGSSPPSGRDDHRYTFSGQAVEGLDHRRMELLLDVPERAIEVGHDEITGVHGTSLRDCPRQSQTSYGAMASGACRVCCSMNDTISSKRGKYPSVVSTSNVGMPGTSGR